uniref:Acyl dehydratase n=1 Tax=Rheinheimera sp. BAL341 TaxID=1708203 RepID=A0A486XU87_9GAMM
MEKHNTLPELNVKTLIRLLLKGANNSYSKVSVKNIFRCTPPYFNNISSYKTQIQANEDRIPLTFYYTLAQRAQLACMLGSSFPFRAAGMVQVENSIERYSDLNDKECIEIDNTYIAIEENGRLYVDFETLINANKEPRIRCKSRYFIKRLKEGIKSTTALQNVNLETLGQWTIGEDAGRLYASVSGDWNPIHLWGWSAKLFGMKQPIIHGMQTVGNAASLIEKQYGLALKQIDSKFVRPIALGEVAELQVDSLSLIFRVCVNKEVCVIGRYI